MIEFSQSDQKRGNDLKQMYRALWACGTIKKEVAERTFEEVITKNFSRMSKDTNLQIKEAGQTPNRINPNKSMPSHIIIKLLKI